MPSVNILRSSSPLSFQADCASPSDKCLPRGQLNLSASHSISAVIRHIIGSKHTQPNAFDARIVVPSRLNLPAWQAGLTNYHDSEVALFLAHGWPVNYCLLSGPAPFDTNHSSAVNFAQTVDSSSKLNCPMKPQLVHSNTTQSPQDYKRPPCKLWTKTKRNAALF